MMLINLPIDFQRSLSNTKSWPANSILKNTNAYHKALEFLRSRLDSAERTLFERDEKQWEIPIRDLSTAAGEKAKKFYAHTEDKLKAWLQVLSVADSNNPGLQVPFAGQKDPKCRFM